MSDMQKWYKFGAKNQDSRKAFQDLSLDLFCRKFGIDYSEIQEYHNQEGIEIEPVFDRNAKKYRSFQAKCFDVETDYDQVKKSIQTAVNLKKGGRYPNLDIISMFINRKLKKSNKDKEKIEKVAKEVNIEIDWCDWGGIENLVKKYPELEAEYFGLGDSTGFILDTLNKNAIGLWQSGVYLELSLEDTDKKEVSLKDIEEKIVKGLQQPLLIRGNPGSGKSMNLQRLVWNLGGLDLKKADQIKRREVVGLPILINLRTCTVENIESFIYRQRQKFGINQTQKLFYLVDGVDEVPTKTFSLLLDALGKLSAECPIVLASRSGNLNLGFIKSLFPTIEEYRIKEVTVDHISAYFERRGNPKKIDHLKKILAAGVKPEIAVKDILLLRLFYNTIEDYKDVHPDFFVLQIYSSAVAHLCNPIYERRAIDLNILDPKHEHIHDFLVSLVKSKSNQLQLDFTLEEIQSCIQREWPKMTYNDINEIVNFLSSSFFDSVSSQPT